MKEDFIKEDSLEPFGDREYVGYAIDFYDALLTEDPVSIHGYDAEAYDIVMGILQRFREQQTKIE